MLTKSTNLQTNHLENTAILKRRGRRTVAIKIAYKLQMMLTTIETGSKLGSIASLLMTSFDVNRLVSGIAVLRSIRQTF